MLQPADSFPAVQFTINRVTVEDRHNTPEFEAAGYLWYLLTSLSSSYLCVCCSCTHCAQCSFTQISATDSAPTCRNLLVFSRGKDRNPNALGIFLNAAGKDQPFGWQRRGVKFSLCVVNRLDFSKSVVKGKPAPAQPRNNSKKIISSAAGCCMRVQFPGLQPSLLCTTSEAGSQRGLPAVRASQSQRDRASDLPTSHDIWFKMPPSAWPETLPRGSQPHAWALLGDASNLSCPLPGTHCSVASPMLL